MAKKFYNNKFVLTGIVILVAVIGFSIWFDQLQEFEKQILLIQLSGITTNEIVYDAGLSSANFEGYQIISCLRGHCVAGMTYIPAQVTCNNTGGVTVSEFDYPEACPAPIVKQCSNGSTIPVAQSCPIPDSDGDGFKDNVDSCPNDPNPTHNGCPIPLSEIDTDGDGIFDDVDLCIGQAENINGLNDFDGCPDVIPLSSIDTDGDLIFDDVDQCTNEPETFNLFEDEDGCPDVKPIVDTDGDGIVEEIDLCPNTPSGVGVDNDGCPIPDPDADNDGVPDDVDECPNTSSSVNPNPVGCGGNQVDSDADGIFNDVDVCPNVIGTAPDGCPIPELVVPLDSDDDGIINANDVCPNTPANQVVDVSGCELPVVNNIIDDIVDIITDEEVVEETVVVETVTDDTPIDDTPIDDTPIDDTQSDVSTPSPTPTQTSNPVTEFFENIVQPTPTPTPTQTTNLPQTTTSGSPNQNTIIDGVPDSLIYLAGGLLVVVVIVAILLGSGKAKL